MLTKLLRLVYPTYCCSCHKHGSYVCDTCYELIHYFNLPVPVSLEPCFLDQVIATAEYAPPISSVIHSLKYQSVRGLAEWCAELIYQHAWLPEIDCLTFIPISSQRQRERGFNQAQEIAQHLAAKLEIPCLDILQRLKHTAAQATIVDQVERKTRLADCFGLKPNAADQLSPSSQTSIAIVDDVVTTGSTLNQCAKLLKESGFGQVYGLAVAHGV